MEPYWEIMPATDVLPSWPYHRHSGNASIQGQMTLNRINRQGDRETVWTCPYCNEKLTLESFEKLERGKTHA